MSGPDDARASLRLEACLGTHIRDLAGRLLGRLADVEAWADRQAQPLTGARTSANLVDAAV